MGLFSTLLSSTNQAAVSEQDAEGVTVAATSSSTASSSSSSLSLPTVVQMYTTKAYQLEKTSSSTSKIPSYAYLTYQAVQSMGLAAQAEADQEQQQQQQQHGLRNSKTAKMEAIPDLGVWNCRVTPNPIVSTTPSGDPVTAGTSSSLGDSVLSLPSVQACDTFCWRVDLSQPAAVEPTLTRLQQALVRHLIRNTNTTPVTTSETTATTSLYELRSVQFGLAQQDDTEKSAKQSTAAPAETDRQVKVTLQICATWPTGTGAVGSSTTGEGGGETASKGDENTTTSADYSYRQQQTLALVFYHLRRYAAALNASLVFVRETVNVLLLPDAAAAASSTSSTTTTTTTTDLQPTLSLPQLAAVWRALAQGKAVWNDLDGLMTDVLEGTVSTTATAKEDEEKDDDDATDKTDTGHALVYGPGTHATDWIESALLRNAQYPGHWDAAQQSVWTILPADEENVLVKSTTTKTPAVVVDAAADQPWLAELRDSVALPAAAATATTPNKPTKTEAKTPDVSDYFANLLNA